MPTNPINPSDYVPNSNKIQWKDAEFAARSDLRRTSKTQEDAIRKEITDKVEIQADQKKELKIENQKETIQEVNQNKNQIEENVQYREDLNPDKQRPNQLDITVDGGYVFVHGSGCARHYVSAEPAVTAGSN